MTRINTNIGALNALKSLSDIGNKLSIAQLRLSTGKRINNAADDAAGFSIAKKFNTRSKGLGQAVNNIGTAKNLISVTEGHLNNIVNILTQIKTKAIQGADDSLGTAERNAINAELAALGSQIDLEVNQAVWNGKDLLNGIKTSGDSSAIFNFQIGAGSTISDVLKFDLFNDSNVEFTANNAGYTSLQMNLTPRTESTSPVSRIDVSQTFANAGFANTPDGSVTINGKVFTLSDYPTVQDLMDDINNDGILLSKGFAYAGFNNTPVGTVTINGWTSNDLSTYASVNAFISAVSTNASATISYSSGTDKFTIYPNTAGTDLVISQSDGISGFFAQSSIATGTYAVKKESSAAITSGGGLDTTKTFNAAGFTNTPDGTVTINGWTSNDLSTYASVDAFISAANTNADVTINYDGGTDKFSIYPNTAGTDLTISETGTFALFTESNITTGTSSHKKISTSEVGANTNANISYDSNADMLTIAKTSGASLTISESGTNGFLTESKIVSGTYGSSTTSTGKIRPELNIANSFADAGFVPTPTGTVTINSKIFTLSDYSTVQGFMDAINNDSDANAYITYDSTEDKFIIKHRKVATPLVISESGSPDGFLTSIRIPEGTYIDPSASSSSFAQNLMINTDNAIADISSSLSYIGSIVNRLTYQEESLTTSKTNTEAARSRIEDADMAEEQLNATKLQILQQTSSAMLAQANISPQTIMNLFK